MTKNERILLITLAAINFTNIMDFMIMMPLGPQLMRIFDITPQQFGLIVSSYTLSAGVSGFFTAFIIDRFDRKKFLQLLYVGFLIGTLLCGLAPNYYMLVAARILTGLFGGVLGAIILAIVGDTIPFERRGQAMGMVMAAFSVASVFGVPFGLFIATQFDWHAPFLFLTVIALPLSYFIWKFVPDMNSHIKKDNSLQIVQVIKNITSDPNQRKSITLLMVLMLGHFSIIPFLSPYMVANVGFKESQLTYIYLFGGLLTIFTSPRIGKLADKYGKVKIFTWFVSLCTIPVVILTNLGPTPIWLVLIVSTAFFILSAGRFIPAQAIVTSTVKPENRGSFMSISSSMQQLTAGVGSYFAGVIIVKDQVTGELHNYNLIGWFSAAAALTTLYLIRRIRSVDGDKF